MAWAFIELNEIDALGFVNQQTGGHHQFLTIQGLWLAMFTYALAVASDLFPANELFVVCRRTLLLIALPVRLSLAILAPLI
jgi:hypothetical protein